MKTFFIFSAERIYGTNRFVMWKGRFSQPTADLVLRYGESVSYDWRLYRHDIAGSIAHARAQLKAGLLTEDEFAAIQSGLEGILSDIEAGHFTWSQELEDVHMNIESELTRRIGAPGAKLHTARSRNDQVATDTRLYCRDAVTSVIGKVRGLQRALLAKAREYADDMMPGYTHLQRAQPVTFGHHLLAYVEMFDRDVERLESCRERLNVSPLGSGAIAGSTICLDRESIAQELGFNGVTQNSMDAIADRDYIMEFLFDLALIGTHLSRMSEDMILWCSSEFGFITLDDAHTTGSSLMPQKKNPDVCELTRGKTGRLYGNLTSVMVAVKGLPLTYNRDLQEDKEPLFDSIDTVELALDVNAEMVSGLIFNRERAMQAASDPMLLATDLADYLVRKGVPFRQAHELVGKAVAMSVASGTPLNRLTDEQFASISEAYGADARDVFQLERAFSLRKNPGAPNPEHTARRIAYWEQKFA
ncbi:argininosuccinate lyase [Akkermansia sp. N21169]|nr:argininosuccinate lyase [Akkermansia sp. N21169]